MDSTPPPARLFVTRALPWILCAAALVLFVSAMSHWVTVVGLVSTVSAAGWDWTLPVGRPLVYLVGLVLKAVAGPRFPMAANVLTAVLASVTVWILARCVALLPHDRTQSQRVRERSEIGLLTISLAWIPPLLAVLGFACALTVAQHATSFTGEMIDLVVFAYCVLCLLEYRLDRSEGRLARLAFVYGVGMANNWAMVGYLPMFMVALGWILGFESFRVRLFLRLFAFGAAGLLLFLLVVPVAAQFYHRFDESVWAFLLGELEGIKGSMLATPRGKVALFAVIMLLPLALVGVRWTAFADKTLESISTQFVFHLAQIAWLFGCLAVVLDSNFSPRHIVIYPALLTFYFCAALSIGYFAGYYLLVASRTPKEMPRGEIPFLGVVSKLVSVFVVAACVGLPVYFVKKNFPIVQAENRGALYNLSEAIYQALPSQPSLLLVDDSFSYNMLLARAKSQPAGVDHLVLNTALAPSQRYREYLAREHAQVWPGLSKLAAATQNVAGIWLSTAAELSKSGRAFFGNQTYGFFNEHLDFVPSSGAFTAKLPTRLVPAPISQAEGDQVVAFWKRLAPELELVSLGLQRGATNLSLIAQSWSRMQDVAGVDLQRAGRLAEARELFEASLRICPLNASAKVNLRMNDVLAKKTKIPADIDKPLENQPGVLDRYGPVDEPSFLYYYGRSLLRPQETLVRRAAIAFSRSADLGLDSRLPGIGYAEACLVLGLTSDATNSLDTLRRQTAMSGWPVVEQGEWFRVRALADAQMNDVAGAEASLLAARKVDPKNDQVHDALSYLYLAMGKPDEATAALDQWEKELPTSPGSSARRALVLMYQKRFTQALPALNKVLKLSADDEMARLNRAICNLMLTNLSEAKADYKLLLRKRETFQTQFGLAEIARRESNRKDELEHLERYLTIAPKTTQEFTNAVARVAELRGGR